MIKLGLDFDNTLVRYDSLFYKIALDNGLIPSSTKKNKNAVRNFLREQGKEELFTLLQGEVYGSRISEADQSEGMFDELKKIKNQGIKLFIVSHKTKTPYMGPKYDLHKCATEWLEKNNFFSENGLDINRNDVYFELTKEKKVKRIEDIGCSYYIDDLPEILEMINNNIKRIHYNPFNISINNTDIINLSGWNQLEKIILR